MKKVLLFIFLLVGGLLLSTSLIGCSNPTGGGGGGTSDSHAAPSNFSVGPADHSVNVSPTSSVEVTFSESMETSSAQSAFLLTSEAGSVSGTFSWSGYTMTFTPSVPFTNNTTYELSVSITAEDSTGHHLASAYNSTFTTGAAAISSPSITNLIDDLSTSNLSSWTEVVGGAARAGITITSNSNTLYYTRSDLDINNAKAFQIEAKFSAEGLGTDGERGARMWVMFRDSALPPGEVYNAELRLVREGGVNKLKLVDGNSGAIRASLTKNWTQTSPRLRVRIKRQKVSGTDYIILQAEGSSSWDDPTQPNNLSDANSQAVALAGNFSSAADSSQFGFGNSVAGNYYSEWNSVHVTAGEDSDTILPYWLPASHTPILYFIDKGVGISQEVRLSAYCSSEGYVSNDTITAYLNANGALITGETRTSPGDEYWSFVDMNPSQEVTGYVTVSDVSGRSRTSSNGSINIPSR